MQHAGAVRGRDGLGDAQEQFEAGAAIQGREATLAAAGPFLQVLATVLTLEEERRCLEVPVDDAHQVVALAERLDQHAIQRRLTLQHREPLAVARELEHARLACLDVPGEPHLAGAGRIDLSLERIVRPQRHRLRGLQLEPAQHPPAHGRALHRAVQPVTDPRQGHEPLSSRLAEALAQLRHRIGQHVVHGGAPVPDALEQLLLGDHLTDVTQQHAEHLQWLLFEIDGQAAHRELETHFVELGPTETVTIERRLAARILRGRHHATPAGSCCGTQRGRALPGRIYWTQPVEPTHDLPVMRKNHSAAATYAPLAIR